MSKDERSLAASIIGRRGGKARASALSPERRTEIAKAGGKARAKQRWGVGWVTEDAKPKRPLPKAGTVSAMVIEVLRGDGPNESVDIAKELYYSAKLNARNTTEAYEQVKNALSALRSAGHVVSEPKPGSRREKLWRLA